MSVDAHETYDIDTHNCKEVDNNYSSRSRFSYKIEKKKKKSSIKIMPNLLILEEKQIMHKQFKRSGSWDVEIT